jgi:glyoxylase-like metal-dependent hydrolase (beta-lactamase superfamily II)
LPIRRASLPVSEARSLPGPARNRLDRRGVLRGLCGTAAAALVPVPTIVRAADPELVRINDRIGVIVGLGGNVVAFSNSGGLVLVDSGAAEQANGLIGTLEDLAPGARVATLFNTHWHLDQVGGNAAVRAQGAAIVAHAKTRAHLATPHYLPDEDRYQPALPPEAQPTETFYDSGAVDVAGTTIRYGHLLEAHTDGDIYVQFTSDNVIAAGDAIAPERDPEFDWFGGGWLGGRIDALALLLEISDRQTRFVPAYGAVVGRDYVATEHELMLGLYDILWTRVRAGESAADILASGALDALPRHFDNPAKLLYDVHKGMWAHSGVLSTF